VNEKRSVTRKSVLKARRTWLPHHQALSPANPQTTGLFYFSASVDYAAPRSIRMMMRPTGNPSSQRRIGMFTSLWLLW
jgi:hypothetical protein